MKKVKQNLKVLSKTDLMKLKGGYKVGRRKGPKDEGISLINLHDCPPPEPSDNL
ncbi:MAG: hypothetical protein ACI94Y_002804 [Maribacter sp.]|jgi:hypothetical protein